MAKLILNASFKLNRLEKWGILPNGPYLDIVIANGNLTLNMGLERLNLFMFLGVVLVKTSNQLTMSRFKDRRD